MDYENHPSAPPVGDGEAVTSPAPNTTYQPTVGVMPAQIGNFEAPATSPMPNTPDTPPVSPAPFVPAPLTPPPTPPAPPSSTPTLAATGDEPVPVVKVLSVRGVEYLFMSIALWLGAASLIGVILLPLNGETTMSGFAFPLSLLLTTVPLFAFFFIRLKRAELVNPSLRLDASKRRLSQVTQVLAFLTCLGNIAALIFIILEKIGGDGGGVSIGKALLNILVILLVAGGILAYYWFDEHRQRN